MKERIAFQFGGLKYFLNVRVSAILLKQTRTEKGLKFVSPSLCFNHSCKKWNRNVFMALRFGVAL